MRRYCSLPEYPSNMSMIRTHAQYNSFLHVRIFITLSRLCVVFLRVCVHLFLFFLSSILVLNIVRPGSAVGPNAFVTRSTRMRRARFSSVNRRSTLAISLVNAESSNWDTVSVLGGFLSVSIRLDAYLWNTCGARRPSVLASNISGCTYICALDRRPSCTAYRRRRSIEPTVSQRFVVNFQWNSGCNRFENNRDKVWK